MSKSPQVKVLNNKMGPMPLLDNQFILPDNYHTLSTMDRFPAKCRTCGMFVSGSRRITSNFHSHVKRRHPEVFAKHLIDMGIWDDYTRTRDCTWLTHNRNIDPHNLPGPCLDLLSINVGNSNVINLDKMLEGHIGSSPMEKSQSIVNVSREGTETMQPKVEPEEQFSSIHTTDDVYYTDSKISNGGEDGQEDIRQVETPIFQQEAQDLSSTKTIHLPPKRTRKPTIPRMLQVNFHLPPDALHLDPTKRFRAKCQHCDQSFTGSKRIPSNFYSHLKRCHADIFARHLISQGKWKNYITKNNSDWLARCSQASTFQQSAPAQTSTPGQQLPTQVHISTTDRSPQTSQESNLLMSTKMRDSMGQQFVDNSWLTPATVSTTTPNTNPQYRIVAESCYSRTQRCHGKQQEISTLLLDFIKDYSLPATVVDSPTLRKLVESLNPLYILPDKEFITCQLNSESQQ